MKRNLKVLGLALAAVFAMSAVVASGASAFRLTSSSYPASLSGSAIGTGVLTTNAGTVSCSEETFSGTISEASAEPELTPSYSGCTAFGFVSVPIDVNGCKFRFHITVTLSPDTFEGKVTFVCGASPIAITAPGCTVTIGSQGPLASVHIENTTSASPKKFHFRFHLFGLKYTVNSGCSTTKAGTFTNGTYETAAEVQSSGGLWVD